MNRTAVITGIGVVSPVGIGKKAFWDSLFNGRLGFRPITLFDTSEYAVKIAGEITDFDPVQFLGKKGLRELDRSTRLISAAAKLAIEDSQLQIADDNAYSIGVSVGATFGSLHSISQFDRSGLLEGPRFVNPSHFPNTVINSPASRISIRFRLKGFNTTISTGFCASMDAVSYACDFIRLKRCSVVLAGGVEELCEETFTGFMRLGYLSGTDDSEALCCPFDRRRNGIILSEAGGAILIEDKDHALKRGAPILSRILGYGNAFDPSGDGYFNCSGAGLKKAITDALKEACMTPEEIHCISASANSTRGLDRMETRAIKDIFGERAYSIPVSAIKSMVGETYSASGILSLIAGAGAIKHGTIPPTVNFREKDPDCDLDYVPNKARNSEIENILLISSDPHGGSSAMIIGKYE